MTLTERSQNVTFAPTPPPSQQQQHPSKKGAAAASGGRKKRKGAPGGSRRRNTQFLAKERSPLDDEDDDAAENTLDGDEGLGANDGPRFVSSGDLSAASENRRHHDGASASASPAPKDPSSRHKHASTPSSTYEAALRSELDVFRAEADRSRSEARGYRAKLDRVRDVVILAGGGDGDGDGDGEGDPAAAVDTIRALREILEIDAPTESRRRTDGAENSHAAVSLSAECASSSSFRSPPPSPPQTESPPSPQGSSLLDGEHDADDRDDDSEEGIDSRQFVQEQILSPDLLAGGDGEFEEQTSPVSPGTSEASACYENPDGSREREEEDERTGEFEGESEAPGGVDTSGSASDASEDDDVEEGIAEVEEERGSPLKETASPPSVSSSPGGARLSAVTNDTSTTDERDVSLWMDAEPSPSPSPDTKARRRRAPRRSTRRSLCPFASRPGPRLDDDDDESVVLSLSPSASPRLSIPSSEESSSANGEKGEEREEEQYWDEPQDEKEDDDEEEEDRADTGPEDDELASHASEAEGLSEDGRSDEGLESERADDSPDGVSVASSPRESFDVEFDGLDEENASKTDEIASEEEGSEPEGSKLELNAAADAGAQARDSPDEFEFRGSDDDDSVLKAKAKGASSSGGKPFGSAKKRVSVKVKDDGGTASAPRSGGGVGAPLRRSRRRQTLDLRVVERERRRMLEEEREREAAAERERQRMLEEEREREEASFAAETTTLSPAPEIPPKTTIPSIEGTSLATSDDESCSLVGEKSKERLAVESDDEATTKAVAATPFRQRDEFDFDGDDDGIVAAAAPSSQREQDQEEENSASKEAGSTSTANEAAASSQEEQQTTTSTRRQKRRLSQRRKTMAITHGGKVLLGSKMTPSPATSSPTSSEEGAYSLLDSVVSSCKDGGEAFPDDPCDAADPPEEETTVAEAEKGGGDDVPDSAVSKPGVTCSPPEEKEEEPVPSKNKNKNKNKNKKKKKKQRHRKRQRQKAGRRKSMRIQAMTPQRDDDDFDNVDEDYSTPGIPDAVVPSDDAASSVGIESSDAHGRDGRNDGGAEENAGVDNTPQVSAPAASVEMDAPEEDAKNEIEHESTTLSEVHSSPSREESKKAKARRRSQRRRTMARNDGTLLLGSASSTAEEEIPKVEYSDEREEEAGESVPDVPRSGSETPQRDEPKMDVEDGHARDSGLQGARPEAAAGHQGDDSAAAACKAKTYGTPSLTVSAVAEDAGAAGSEGTRAGSKKPPLAPAATTRRPKRKSVAPSRFRDSDVIMGVNLPSREESLQSEEEDDDRTGEALPGKVLPHDDKNDTANSSSIQNAPSPSLSSSIEPLPPSAVAAAERIPAPALAPSANLPEPAGKLHIDVSDSETTWAQRKPAKRRRRSNAALGGLVTGHDIERLAAESRRRSVGLTGGRNRKAPQPDDESTHVTRGEGRDEITASEASPSVSGERHARATAGVEGEAEATLDGSNSQELREAGNEGGGRAKRPQSLPASEEGECPNHSEVHCGPSASGARADIGTAPENEAEFCDKMRQVRISSSDINTRIKYLFPKEAMNMPCVSARLFACVSILLEKSMTNGGGAPQQGRRLRSKPPSKLQAMQPLLTAFVQAEITTLGDFDKEYQHRKKLRFCTVDFSSTLNPVDRKQGSHTHLEACIDSLHAVLREGDSLCRAVREEMASNETVACVDAIISALRFIGSAQGAQLREECSNSMPLEWPSARFIRTAQMYQEEIQNLASSATSSVEGGSRATSQIRERLGDFIGRAIRFYLRRFFDPCPPTITTPSEEHKPPDLSVSRSRIHELVEMMAQEGDTRDTAAADGSISSVFSLALRSIMEYTALRQAQGRTDLFVESLCSSEACRRGVGTKKQRYTLTEEDLSTIEREISEAHIVLAGVRATRFIHELMHWNGVMASIKAIGGFEQVERYAKLFQAFKLSEPCPAEAHFTLLQDMGSFVCGLESAKKTSEIEKTCQDVLKNVWQSCRCGTKDKRLLHQNPRITDINEHLTQGTKDSLFPALAMPAEEEYEEDEEE